MTYLHLLILNIYHIKMRKICVLQTDNRPSLNYVLKTQEVNKKFCNILGYDYLFLELDNNKYGNIHPATKKYI
jgi:hypothetical protein